MRSSLIFTACLSVATTLAIPLGFSNPFTQTHSLNNIPSILRRTALPKVKDYRRHIIIGPWRKFIRPVKYSANWAGVIQIASNITEITTSLVVPNISLPAGANPKTQYSGSAWIGIDGYSCRNAIFQTGIDWSIRNGTRRYHAWYEWFPDYSYRFTNFAVHAGDRLHISAVTHNATGGTAYIVNETTNKTVSHTFAGQQPLCMRNAEWVVEDYELTTSDGSQLAPFARFEKLHFRNASYCTAGGGKQYGVRNSTILEMNQGGKVLAACVPKGKHKIACTYKGGNNGM